MRIQAIDSMIIQFMLESAYYKSDIKYLKGYKKIARKPILA